MKGEETSLAQIRKIFTVQHKHNTRSNTHASNYSHTTTNPFTKDLNSRRKKDRLHFRRNATVATREPTDPPNMNVGYVRTWLTYWNRGSLHDSSSLATSGSGAVALFLWLKLSTSWTNSSFVLLHDVTTLHNKKGRSERTNIIK